ncbi:hypothetical protein I3842_13G039800 [Carya illinoinensis]|uniref:Pre-rRNA-processing protein RIX1 N-terminal domain-containing protein n=1 Tax=Carya illinoinensis TaxID=32201 RepID=A0A922D5M3_CARIL|nr:hypothetical protein I3842_13G039800 [Carya illinoinensis]
MAAFNHVKNMYDVSLKPRLLRTLIKEDLPDETHPFRNPAGLSTVVSMIKTHGLLSESSFGESTNRKQIENWKSAVDSWVERLDLLVSHAMPDKCWAGICLLGVTCQECSSDRFLASYDGWFHKLLPFIQSPADSHFVKVASCASLSDMFTRLGGFPNQKKDGTSHFMKLVQPVLKLLNYDSSEAIWEGAVQLICTAITYFPSSIHRHYESASHYDSTETAIASKLLSGKCSADMLKKLAHCLALLPKSRGDEESWSLMMQKILLLINAHLNDTFQGLEEETTRNEAGRLLVPPGKDPPPPLGGHTLPGEVSDNPTRRSERLLISSVSTLMLCCCTMLTSSYPVQQELICSELPVLHSYSLELLSAVIKGTRSQLLPHAASIVRLITSYFKRCALPELRIKVYSITRILLISMGVGVAIYLAQEVIDNAFVDLHQESGCTTSSVNSKASSEALLQPSHRKRKHVTTTGYLEEQHDRGGLQVEAPKNHSISPISVRVAALEALEALFTVGGALRSESWRSNVDLLLINTATSSLEGKWASEENHSFQPNEPTSIWVDFQLAALRALLASLLSSVHVRPPYLAQGLELFRRGKQETGTKLAEFCAHALLALEVLIHPRALPLIGSSPATCNSFEGVNRKFSENMYSGSLKHSGPFASGIQGIKDNIPNSDDDDLYERWLENGKETDALDSVPCKSMRYDEDPSEALGVTGEENLYVDNSSGATIPEGQKLAASGVDGMRGNNDEIMVEAGQFEENVARVEEPVSSKDATAPASIEGSLGSGIIPGRFGSSSGASDHVGNVSASSNDNLVAKGDGFATTGMNSSTTTISEEIAGDEFNLDGEDPFPEILDVEPDSDEEQY